MKKPFNRILAFLVCLLLFVGLLPNVVFAKPLISKLHLAPLKTVTANGNVVSSPVKTEHSSYYRTAVAATAPYYLLPAARQTSVKNQNPYGTCWAHGAMASAESLAKTNGLVTDLDLSEWQHVYYSYTKQNGRPAYTLPTGVTPYNRGGNDYQSMAMMARGTSPVLEADAPYNGSTPSASLTRDYDLYEVYIGHDADEWKSLLLEKGALSISYFHDDAYYKAANKTYFKYNSNGYSNHTVTLVGWDDNFPAESFSPEAPYNGAWIIKNSWGTDWGDGGYFYMSYYCADVEAEAFAYELGNVPADESITTYADLGLVGSLGTGSTNYGYIKCVFTSSGATALTAVGTYALADATQYQIMVRPYNASTGQYANAWSSTQNGIISKAGYARIDIASPVYLANGQKYEVIIKLITPQYYYPLPVEAAVSGYSDQATVQPGQSFFSDTGSVWNDGSDYGCDAAMYVYADTTPNTAQNLTVRFNSKGGGPVATQYLSSGSKANQPVAPLRYGYTFTGWYKEQSLVNLWNFNVNTVTGNTILYAGWAAKEYTVTLNWQNGSANQNISVAYNSPLPNITAPVRENFIFKYWSLTPDGSKKWENNTVVQDITLYAIWVPAKCTVTVTVNNSDYGTVTGAGEYAYESSVSVNAVPKAGCRFVQWTQNSNIVSNYSHYYFIIRENTALTAEFALIETPAYLNAVSESYNSVILNWPDITGKSGYEIYMSTSETGTYTLIGDAFNPYFQANGLTMGTQYFFKVRAYYQYDSNSYTYGEFSPVASAIPTLQQTNSLYALSAGYNSIKLNWYSVTAAEKYEIFRSASETGEFEKIGETATPGYTDTGLTTGNTYYYQICACAVVNSISYYSSFSNIASIAPMLSSPDGLIAVSASYNSIYLCWSPVNGATKYQIYFDASSTGNYVLLAETTSTNYTHTNLLTGNNYQYKVLACRVENGTALYSYFSGVSYCSPVLPVPAGLKAASTSGSSVDISWSAVTGATKYEVYRSASSGGSYTLQGETASLSFINTGLTAGTTYYYKVKAYILVGSNKVYSDYSVVVSITTDLPAPTSVQAASVGYNSIEIKWSVVSGASKYEVYRSASSGGTYTLQGETVSLNYINLNLTTNATYYYKVRAYRLVGNTKIYGGYSPVVSAKPLPATPTGVQASSAGYNSIQVKWAAVSGATKYEVYRATSSGGTYTLQGETASLSYTNANLTAGTAYYYKVRAYRLMGSAKVYGNFSAVVSAKPILPTPTGVQAASAGYNSIKISWAAVAGATKYQVYRATSSGGTYTLLGETASLSYTNTILTTGTAYYYKVRAYRLVGSTKIYSSYSAIVNTKPIPATPTGVQAASASYNSVKVKWSAVAGATKYQVYRATSSGGTYSLLGETSSLSYNNTSLATGTTYYYKVRAYRLVGSTKIYSSYSAVVKAAAVPAVPSGVAVTRKSSTSVRVSWAAVAGATKYEVYRATSSGGTYSLVTTTTSLNYTNTGLTTGRTYYYKVRAYRLVGSTKVYSAYSSIVSVRP